MQTCTGPTVSVSITKIERKVGKTQKILTRLHLYALLNPYLILYQFETSKSALEYSHQELQSSVQTVPFINSWTCSMQTPSESLTCNTICTHTWRTYRWTYQQPLFWAPLILSTHSEKVRFFHYIIFESLSNLHLLHELDSVFSYCLQRSHNGSISNRPYKVQLSATYGVRCGECTHSSDQSVIRS